MLEFEIKTTILFKNHEDNFDERYHLNDGFRVVYLK
jgi:hypothetical protein